MKILILDNFDSFTYNLVHILSSVEGTDLVIKRNDEISLPEIEPFDKIILSPGPGLPSEAGIMPELIKYYSETKSIFGVCLGLQGIVEAFSGRLKNLEEPLHGMETRILVTKDSEKLFRGIPSSFKGGHYHSWVADEKNFPECLEITALDVYGNIMALRHRSFDVCGVQFHPESILTEHGKKIIRNWVF